MRRLTGFLCAWAAATNALAPANPFGWEETQPDGSPVGRLFLRGHPKHHAYISDKNDHPVVVDNDGWYVYGARNDNGTSLPRGEERRLQLWYPTVYRVTPDSRPPRHLLDEEVTARSFPSVSVEKPDIDFLCENQQRTPWCPNNKPLVGRSADPPRTRGVSKVLVVLIRFSDHKDREMPPKEDIEFLFKGEGTDDDRAPTGTMRDFFRLQSLGEFSVDAHVEDWIDAPEDEEFYSFENYGLTNKFARACYAALDRMDKDGVDWSQFDLDSDGILDNVVIFHSGFVAEGGGSDCHNEKAHGPHRIWSHATTVSDDAMTWYSEDRSVRIGRYCTTSAVYGTCGPKLQRIGVIGHEMLHTLGLPDILGNPGTGVGIYDVMGMMWGPDGSLLHPGLASPWSRILLRWAQPTIITSSGQYTIRTAQLYGDVYKIPLAPGEYLLIENRQKLYLDEMMPGTGGLLIWHIDDTMLTDWMSLPGWPSTDQEGWPGNGHHYQLALLSPDGRYDNERGRNYGDKFDCWTNGTSLEPGPGRQSAIESEFDMYPNTDSYSGGNVQTTGIRVYDISEIGETMTFKVEIPGTPTAPPTTPKPTKAPTASPTVSPTGAPTGSPTLRPTDSPTASPTASPTSKPTGSPTPRPTPVRTEPPSASPTPRPTPVPTAPPTPRPTPLRTPPPTNSPTPKPSPKPTPSPTQSPPTPKPSPKPTAPPTQPPSNAPSESPLFSPINGPVLEFAQPITAPVTTDQPSTVPSGSPSTNAPSDAPSLGPTNLPSDTPSQEPSSNKPSENPTVSPTPPTVPPPTLGNYAYVPAPTPRGKVLLRRPYDTGR